MGLSLDLANWFDSIPTRAVTTLLHLAGIHIGTAQIIENMVSGMRRRWRLPGRTLSSYPEVCAVADVIFLMQNEADLHLLRGRLSPYGGGWHRDINESKTFVFTTDDEQRRQWRSGHTVPNFQVQDVFAYLSVLMDTRGARSLRAPEHPVAQPRAMSMSEKSLASVMKVRSLPLSIAHRGVLLGASAGLAYAPWTWKWKLKAWSCLVP